MRDDVEEVKSKSDIVAIIGERVQLKKAGRNYRGLCPFHQEKSPSFMVSPELQIYKCFGCSESGDVISFLEKFEGMDFGEALKYLAEKAGVKLTSYKGGGSENEKLFEVNFNASKFYNYVLLEHPAGKKALDYLLTQRGLTIETIKEFNLGFSPESSFGLKDYLVGKKKFNLEEIEKAGIFILRGRDFFDRLRGRIIFPIHDHRGNVAGFSGRIMPGGREDTAKYVNTPDTPIYHKSKILFGLNKSRDVVKKKGVVIVVEGQLDAISTYQIGIKNVVAVGGTAFTPEQTKLLSRFCQKMILCLDADVAGESAEVRSIATAFNEGFEIKIAKLPEGIKDPDEAARNNPDEFKKSLINSIGIWEFLIDQVFSKYDKNSGDGKAKISKVIAPILRSIDDDIVSNHYSNLVASRLGVTVESVTKQLSKTDDVFMNKKDKEENEFVEETKNRRTLLEERVLSISFQTNPEKLKELNVSELVSTPLASRILEEYLEYSKVNQKFDIPSFAEALPKELVKGFSEMFMSDVGDILEYPQKTAAELILCMKELEIMDIRRKLEETGVKIRQLERDNDPTQLQKAQIQFNELAQRLSGLGAKIVKSL